METWWKLDVLLENFITSSVQVGRARLERPRVNTKISWNTSVFTAINRVNARGNNKREA